MRLVTMKRKDMSPENALWSTVLMLIPTFLFASFAWKSSVWVGFVFVAWVLRIIQNATYGIRNVTNGKNTIVLLVTYLNISIFAILAAIIFTRTMVLLFY